jgi:hypothetical protein
MYMRWLSLLLWAGMALQAWADPPELLGQRPEGAGATLSVSATSQIDALFRAFDSRIARQSVRAD